VPAAGVLGALAALEAGADCICEKKSTLGLAQVVEVSAFAQFEQDYYVNGTSSEDSTRTT